MADSFFGFDSDPPDHGMGKMAEDGPAVVEDEIDLMNDETFGALMTDDWEEQHEKMAGQIRNFDTEPLDVISRNDYFQLRNTADSRGESPENELEHSINQLMVDDDDDATRGRPIPVRRLPVNLDNLFGASSPPGLFEAENLVTGHQNIWGSPTTKESYVRKQDQGLKMLLKQMQKGNQGSPQVNELERANFNGKMSHSLPEAYTLEEIEGSLSKSGQQQPGQDQRTLTVEELEMQLTGSSHPFTGFASLGGNSRNHVASSPAQSKLPLPIGTPPQGSFMKQSRSQSGRVFTENVVRRTSPTTMVTEKRGGRVSPPQPTEHNKSSPAIKPLMSAITTPAEQRPSSQHGSHTDPMSQGRGRGNYGHRGGHKHNLYYQEREFRDRSRQDSYGNYQGRGNRGDWGYYRHDDRDRHRYQQRGDREWGGYEKGSGEYRSPGQYHHHHHKARHIVGPHGDSDGEDEDSQNRDEYAGLMIKREKDWIIKIQLMQLQTDNPYLDDFYFTMWQLKKLSKERMQQEVVSMEKSGSGPALVLPQLSGRFEFKPYKPVQFENSLGKLTAASVHNPRQIIDVRRDPAQKDDAKGRELRRFRQLLLDIEQAYDLLLVIDDLDKRAMALPEDARAEVLDSRKAAIHSMFLGMRADCEEADFFSRVINVRKGIKLISRLLPMLQQDEGVKMTIALLKLLGDVVNKKGWSKTVLPTVYDSLSCMISQADLETLVEYAATFQRSQASFNLTSALQNQFGSSVIWCLVKRGETIYVKESPLDLDVKDQKNWVEFIEQIAEYLSSMDSKDLPAVPANLAKSVEEHLKRQLHRSLYLSVEDTLQQWTVSCEEHSSSQS